MALIEIDGKLIESRFIIALVPMDGSIMTRLDYKTEVHLVGKESPFASKKTKEEILKLIKQNTTKEDTEKVSRFELMDL